MYISVSEAAKNFKISKRRVQILCENSRIEGAVLINGIWNIPKDAKKPTDARRKNNIIDDSISSYNDISSKEYLNIKDVCNILSISEATVKNWVKLGKIKTDNNKLFNKNDIEQIYKNIQDGSDNKLKNLLYISECFCSNSSLFFFITS